MILEKKKNVRSGVIWGFISQLITIILPFIIRSLIIRRLGAEYAGLSSLFTSVLQVLSLAELGFGSAMVYAMYKPVAEDDYDMLGRILSYYRKIYLVIGLVVLVVGSALFPFLGFLINGDVPSDVNIYILYAIYLFNTVISYQFLSYRASLLSAYQREDLNSLAKTISNIAMYVLQLVFILTLKNYYLYVVWFPFATLLFNIIRYFIAKKKYKHITPHGEISTEQKKEIKKNVYALFFHSIGSVVLNSIDNIVISVMLGLVVLASYNNYYIILSSISGFMIVIFNTMCAGIGNSIILKSKEENYKEFFSIFAFNGVLVSFCTLCFFSEYQNFIALWVGEELVLPFVTMILFCVYFFIHIIRRTVLTYRDAYGLWKETRFQPIVSALFNLGLNIALVYLIGLNGILISTILAMTLIDVPWETYVLFKKMGKGVKKYIYYNAVFIIATALACTGLYFINSLIDINYWVNVILYLLTAVGVFIVIMIPLYFLIPEIKFYIIKIKRRIFRKGATDGEK